MEPHRIFIDRLEKARPSCSRIELRIGSEQRQPATRAVVGAGLVVVDENTAEPRLRALGAENLILRRRQTFLPLILAQYKLVFSFWTFLLKSPGVLWIRSSA